jgi:acetolactate synthase-1/3 small subunit
LAFLNLFGGADCHNHGSTVSNFVFLAALLLIAPSRTIPALRFTGSVSMRHVISALVINEPGVLANVANMFSARAFNIDSLVVGRTEDPQYSRMTIVVVADDNTLDQVRKQLAKLVPVIEVRDFKDWSFVERDLALITVGVGADKRGELLDLTQLFGGKVVDVGPESIMIEMTGGEEELDRFIDLLRPYGISELARTGAIGQLRGVQPTSAPVAIASVKRTRSINAPASIALPPS